MDFLRSLARANDLASLRDALAAAPAEVLAADPGPEGLARHAALRHAFLGAELLLARELARARALAEALAEAVLAALDDARAEAEAAAMLAVLRHPPDGPPNDLPGSPSRSSSSYGDVT